MTDRTGFRRAIEKHDLDALMSVFHEDAVLHSPITFPKILVFRTKVRQGDKLRDVEGIDLIRFDEQGMVRDLTVMVRPRSSLESLLAEVQPRLIAAMQADAR